MISSFYVQNNQTVMTDEEIERAQSQKQDSKKDDSLIQDDNSSGKQMLGSKNMFGGKSQKSLRRSIEKDS